MVVHMWISCAEDLKGETYYTIWADDGRRKCAVQKTFNDFLELDAHLRSKDMLHTLELPRQGCFGVRNKLNLFGFRDRRHDALRHYMETLATQVDSFATLPTPLRLFLDLPLQRESSPTPSLKNFRDCFPDPGRERRPSNEFSPDCRPRTSSYDTAMTIESVAAVMSEADFTSSGVDETPAQNPFSFEMKEKEDVSTPGGFDASESATAAPAAAHEPSSSRQSSPRVSREAPASIASLVLSRQSSPRQAPAPQASPTASGKASPGVARQPSFNEAPAPQASPTASGKASPAVARQPSFNEARFTMKAVNEPEFARHASPLTKAAAAGAKFDPSSMSPPPSPQTTLLMAPQSAQARSASPMKLWPRSEYSPVDASALEHMATMDPALTGVLLRCMEIRRDEHSFENRCEQAFTDLRRGLMALQRSSALLGRLRGTDKKLRLSDVPASAELCDFLLLVVTRRRIMRAQVLEIARVLLAASPEWASAFEEVGVQPSLILQPVCSK
eukprot:TRINITY_DN1321_c0_g1_i1.p1 TRINITY_DN1321_c0_g1~~TRINITY_DN1321_c0_g1_i1.p1  ORF type:complete len:502 (-),score=99.50 TRINITY_DN1321_c0_g1_i1:189-1694(-)